MTTDPSRSHRLSFHCPSNLTTLAIAAVVCISLSGAPLRAATVTVNLSGQVTSVSQYGNVVTGVNLGDAVSFTAVIDTAVIDQSPAPDRTLQSSTSGSAYLRVDIQTTNGPLSFWSGPAGSGDPMTVYTFDQSGYSPGDYFEVSSGNQTGVNWPAPLFSNGSDQIILSLLDQLAPYDLVDGVTPPPAGIPDLAKVTTFYGVVRGNNYGIGGGGYSIEWQLLPVPEPSASVLAGLGLLGVGLFSRRNKYRRV